MDLSKITRNQAIVIAMVIAIILYIVIEPLFNDWGLKSDIKDRDEKIEQIDEAKKPILESITKDEEALKKKDSIILALSNQQRRLYNTIKNLRNENDSIKNAYVNSSLNERIRRFSELATEKDSI